MSSSENVLEKNKEAIADALAKGSHIVPGWTQGLFALFFLLGVGAIFFGFAGVGVTRTWAAVHVNVIFWSGLAIGGVLFSAVIHITNGIWARTIRRFAESLGAFLPISYVLIAVCFFMGAEYIYPWITNPLESKAVWLNFERITYSNLGALGLLYLLLLKFMYLSLRRDIGVARDRYGYYVKDLAKMFVARWKGEEQEVSWTEGKMHLIAPAIAILYGLVYSLVAFDQIMSLDPHWFSTLFGGYIFISNWYISLALIAIIAAFAKPRLDNGKFLDPSTFHDIGKMIFGFGCVMAYFFWSQYKIIWYANIPEELPFIMRRLHEQPWQQMAFISIAMCFFLPFFLLVFKNNKMYSNRLRIIALIPFFGVLLERFVLVYPSILHTGMELPLGLFEVAVTLGFLGLFGLTVSFYLTQFPILPVGDPIFETKLERLEHH